MDGIAFPVARSPRRLFLISFSILFLEMAAIRWLNASVSVLMYFNNLILISCFFGLGLGCLLAARHIDLIRYAAPALLLMVVSIVLLEGLFGFNISYTEDVILSGNVEYFETGALHISGAALGGFFINVAFFVFLGQELGKQLNAVDQPLVAYAYDIAGSLAAPWARYLSKRFLSPCCSSSWTTRELVVSDRVSTPAQI